MPLNQHYFPLLRNLINKQNSTIYTDKFRTYDELVFNGYKHYRINHFNGIENFWSFAKLRLAKFRGLFYYHLKECEFRYNKKYDMMKLLEAKLKVLLV